MHILSKTFDKLPRQYLDEFMGKQALLTKTRVQLFCILAVGIYFFASVLSGIVYPEDFKPEEIPVIIFLVISAFVIFYINKSAKTLKTAKLNAYLFTALLLAVLTRVSIIYYDYIGSSSAIYLFVLFLVAFTIPWMPIDVLIITSMHILAYSSLFFYFQEFIPQHTSIEFGINSYFDGIIFLSMGFVLCLVLRRKETARDIENFVLLKEVEKKNKQMQRELELATRVHKTLIPKSMRTDLVDVSVMYLPMYYIGGDYAKFHFVDRDKLIFIICDVTGHGVSAALLVNRLHTEFERFAQEGKEPGVLLKELDDFIVRDFEGLNMYLSAFCGLLDFKNRRLAYSNHGHPAQYIYRISESRIHRLNSQATLLGLPFNDTSVYQHEINFGKGDKILLFTDGVLETKNEKGEEYGRDRVEGFIKKEYNLQADLFNRTLLDELNTFKHENFTDDIFILNIHIK